MAKSTSSFGGAAASEEKIWLCACALSCWTPTSLTRASEETFFFSHHVSREAQNLGAIGGSRIPSRLFERGLTSSAVSAWCA